MSPESLSFWLPVGGRLAQYVVTLALVGAVVFRFGVLPRIDADVPATDAGAVISRLARYGAVLGFSLILIQCFRLYAQTYAVFGIDEEMSIASMMTVWRDMSWGDGWTWQMVAGSVATAAFAVAVIRPTPGWPLSALGAAAIVFSIPITGHALAREDWKLTSYVLQVIHVAGAGVWLGTLAVVLGIAIPRMAAADESEHGMSHALINAFSPIALVGFGALTVSGIFTSFVYFERLSQMWTTAYGRTLLLKLFLVGLVVASGLVNWRILRPRVSETGDQKLRRVALVELALANLVLIVTAVFTSLSQPGE